MKFTPVPRTVDIIVQDINDEVLIYDLSVQKAYSLNETTAVVWRNLDGKNSLDDLASKSGLPREMVLFAVDELQKQNLLDGKIETGLPKDKLSRRKALLAMGASAIALPVITTMVAPLAVQAQSRCRPGGQPMGTLLGSIPFLSPFVPCSVTVCTPTACSTGGFGGAGCCIVNNVTATCNGNICECRCGGAL